MKKNQNQPIVLVRILLILMVAYLIFYMFRMTKDKKNIEGFTQKKKFELRTNNDIYDNFYSDIYDKIMYDKNKLDYEIEELTNLTKMNKKSTILDIGSGNGHHVGALYNAGMNAVGIDLSKYMILDGMMVHDKIEFHTILIPRQMNIARSLQLVRK